MELLLDYRNILVMKLAMEWFILRREYLPPQSDPYKHIAKIYFVP